MNLAEGVAASNIAELQALAAGGALELLTAAGVAVASLTGLAVSDSGAVILRPDDCAAGGTVAAARLLDSAGELVASLTAGVTGEEDLALAAPAIAEGDAVSATLAIWLEAGQWRASGAVRSEWKSRAQLYRVTGVRRIPGAPYKVLSLQPTGRPLNR